MSDPITNEEKSQLREILSNFYGSASRHWEITPRTFELFGDLVERTKGCDSAMDAVPRPFGGGNVVKWASKQVRSAVLRAFKDQAGRHYISCMRSAALGMRSQFEMAQYGQ